MASALALKSLESMAGAPSALETIWFQDGKTKTPLQSVFCGLPAAWLSARLLVALCDCRLHSGVEIEVGGETHVVPGKLPADVFVHTCARH